MKVIHIKQAFRKTISLQISDNGEIIVKTNKIFPNFLLNQFLEKNRKWIEKRLESFEKNKRDFKKREFVENEIFEILGEKYRLRFQKSKLKRMKVEIKNGEIVICKNDNFNNPDKFKEELAKFFKSFARSIFEERTDYFTKIYNLKYKRILIKDQKSKWGSCSSNKNLNYNWKLIFAPKEVFDYVVIHEICHLEELNHSRNFWNLVKRECPDFKAKKDWLKQNGNVIRRSLEFYSLELIK